MTTRRRPRMYCRGEKYQSVSAFVDDWQRQRGRTTIQYAYWNHKLMHLNFVAAMSLAAISRAIGEGILYHAIRNKEEPTKW